MKVQKSFLLGLTTVAIALTATPTFSQSSSNNSILFDCKIIENTPTTVFYNSQNQEQYKALIHWKKEYINSENISLLCDSAAKKLQSRYDKEEEFGYLAFERNSNNQTVACLINQRGKSCNLSGEELFRIQLNTREDLYNALVAIVDPNLSELDKNTIESQFRGVDRTYSRMKTRNFWERLLSRKY